MRTHLYASSMGCYVQESLRKASEGKVLGITSKGIFFEFEQRSIFLTKNDHNSPFNIILAPSDTIPSDITSGDIVYFSQGDLLIPTREVAISLANIPVWTPPPPIRIVNSLPEQVKCAQQLLSELMKLDRQKGFLFLKFDPPADSTGQAQIRQAAAAFTQSVRLNNLQASLEASTHLFGLGSGLTPSGDDWITGFVLYQCRLDQAKKIKRPFLTRLGAELVYTAYLKTTWVSANRLEAALKGWSEEIFLSAIDYLFGANRYGSADIARGLMNFGHSSGVDTFIGIVLGCEARNAYND